MWPEQRKLGSALARFGSLPTEKVSSPFHYPILFCLREVPLASLHLQREPLTRAYQAELSGQCWILSNLARAIADELSRQVLATFVPLQPLLIGEPNDVLTLSLIHI